MARLAVMFVSLRRCMVAQLDPNQRIRALILNPRKLHVEVSFTKTPKPVVHRDSVDSIKVEILDGIVLLNNDCSLSFLSPVLAYQYHKGEIKLTNIYSQ